MSRQPFIVQLSVPVDDFRNTLAAAPLEARVIRELSRGQVVVAVPTGRRRALGVLPGVLSVTPDTLQHRLSPRATGG